VSNNKQGMRLEFLQRRRYSRCSSIAETNVVAAASGRSIVVLSISFQMNMNQPGRETGLGGSANKLAPGPRAGANCSLTEISALVGVSVR